MKLVNRDYRIFFSKLANRSNTQAIKNRALTLLVFSATFQKIQSRRLLQYWNQFVENTQIKYSTEAFLNLNEVFHSLAIKKMGDGLSALFTNLEFSRKLDQISSGLGLLELFSQKFMSSILTDLKRSSERLHQLRKKRTSLLSKLMRKQQNHLTGHLLKSLSKWSEFSRSSKLRTQRFSSYISMLGRTVTSILNSHRKLDL